MDSQQFTVSVAEAIDGGLEWVNTVGGPAFDALRFVLDGLYGAVAQVLLARPFVVVAVLTALVGWRAVGLRFGVVAALGFAACAFMGLWAEITATALAIAIPLGILAGLKVVRAGRRRNAPQRTRHRARHGLGQRIPVRPVVPLDRDRQAVARRHLDGWEPDPTWG